MKKQKKRKEEFKSFPSNNRNFGVFDVLFCKFWAPFYDLYFHN